jgi:hypothetical protein
MSNHPKTPMKNKSSARHLFEPCSISMTN